MGPSGIVMAVDEIWLEHRGNEKSACYGAIMVYSTLDACPMGLFSFCHIPCSISLSIPLSGCCTILEPTMETPPNSILDWWNDKTESGRCRKIVGQKKEKERTKGRRLDLNKILLSSAWCASLLLPRKLCIQKHARKTKSVGRKLYAVHALTHLLIHAHYTNLLTLVNSVLHACINTCTTGPLVQFDAFLYVYCIGTSTVHASCK